MDVKRAESSSSPVTTNALILESSPKPQFLETNESGSEKAATTQHEYGPFPGEVAYPPATYLSPGQTFPQLESEYPYIFYLPMHMVHENFAKAVEDVTKVNVDIDSTDGKVHFPRASTTEVESIVEETDDTFEMYETDDYRYPFIAYPYGYGVGFGYPRPFVSGYPRPYGIGYGYGYPRPFVGGYLGPVAPFPFLW